MITGLTVTIPILGADDKKVSFRVSDTIECTFMTTGNSKRVISGKLIKITHLKNEDIDPSIDISISESKAKQIQLVISSPSNNLVYRILLYKLNDINVLTRSFSLEVGAKVEDTESGARIIITDSKGTTTAEVSNGVSPVINIEEKEDGEYLIVEDSEGRKEINLGNFDYINSVRFSDKKIICTKGDGSILTLDIPVNEFASDINPATSSSNGLMSAIDKGKLDTIEPNAQANTITGIKGDAESSYRIGNVNITKENIGLGNVDNTKDSAKNVLSASKLTTARNINGVSFNGTSDITIKAEASGGNASTVNNHTVESDVPKNAKFTDTVYTLPAATSSALGGVKVGSNITLSSGTISLTKSNVTSALGYTPPTTNTTYTEMTGASSTTDGKSGLVPQPDKGEQAKYLRGDGTWTIPPDTTYSNATTSTSGLMSSSDKSKLDGIANGANNYLLPAATSSMLGGVKIGSNISVSSGTISLTKSNIASALGYTPSDTNTTVTNDYLNSLLSGPYNVKISEISEKFPDIEINILYKYSVGFIFTNGINTFHIIDSGSEGSNLYSVGDYTIRKGTNKYVCDYFYNDGKSFKLVRQVDESGNLLSNISSINVDISKYIEQIILPLPINIFVNMIKLKENNISSLTYKACGAYLDGVHDDREYIECCHRICNDFKLTALCNSGKITIFNSGYILIDYDTNLNGSELEITDYNYNGIYNLKGESLEVKNVDYSKLNSNTTYYGGWNSENYSDNTTFKLITNNACIKYNNDISSNESRNDMVLMTHNGRIQYPPIDSATSSTVYIAYPYQNTRISIIGCAVIINTTININNLHFMCIERSNVDIKNFNIISKTDVSLAGCIFDVHDSTNIYIGNIIGNNISLQSSKEGFIIRAISVLKMIIDNCIIDGNYDSIYLNSVKDVLIKNSSINNIVISDYFKDLRIDNCIIFCSDIQIGYGDGLLSITNTKIITDNPYMISLNTDYGDMFKGYIDISNCSIKYNGGEGDFYVVTNYNHFNKSAIITNNRELIKPSILYNNLSIDCPNDLSVYSELFSKDANYTDNAICSSMY